MTRRRLVVLSSAFTLLGLGTLAGLAVVAVLKTQFGRNFARDYVERIVAPRINGKLHIGAITGLSFGGATIDSVEIRGPDDSLFVATRRITVRWDPRDLVDKRTLLSFLEIDGLVMHLRKDSTGTWSYKRVFKSGPPKPRPTVPERGFKDYIVADSVVLRRSSFILSMPWHPDDSLRGAKRDSAITRNLTRKDKEIRRTAGSRFERTWRWTNIELISGYTRLADPDSVGRLFQIARLDADEFDPPFQFRNIRGGVRQTADSLWADLSHFDLPHSTGKGSGKIVWGSGLDTRYDLRIVGDSVSLVDVNWVYPTLPTTGGGSLVLTIKNEQNLKIIDYALSNMDVRTTRSRLLGNMTFGVGGPVLIVKDVDMRAEPMNFDLARTLAGGPFPYDWQGNLTGTVKARGGPVNRFRVDDAVVTFTDANVPGAVTKATAQGELDILFPAFTKFRGFDVNASQLDLRTIQFLNPNFPRLNGIVAGRATLDSSWLDVRFRNADVTHTDGPGEPTRATGSGRVTLGDVFTTYDLALNAEPLSFTTLSHAYQEVALPLRGSYQGPLRIQGTLDDLAITTDLTGEGGRLTYDGRVDGYPVNYAVRGALTFADLNVRSLFGNDTLPVTSLNGRLDMDVSADSASVDSTLTSLAGVVSATIDRSMVDSMRVYQAIARVGFNGGRMRVDTVRVETIGGAVTAYGALGLTNRVDDSLTYHVKVDSLGGLRRYFWPVDTSVVRTVAANDSIDGIVKVDGKARGSIDSLTVTGDVTAEEIFVRGDRADSLVGGFEVRRLNRELSGRLSMRARNAVVSNVGIDSGTVVFVAPNRTSGEFRVRAASQNGPELIVHGVGALSGDTTFVRLDTVGLAVRDHRLMLERSANIVIRPDGVTMDTIRVRDARQGVVTVFGAVPVSAPISLAFRADSLELGDIGELIQANTPFGGVATIRVDVTGVRKDPRITLVGSLDQPRFGDVRLDRATFDGTYASKRMETRADLFRQARSILSLSASVPVDLAFEPVAQRMLSEPLGGKIRSDSVDLAILETLTPLVVNASGTFAANLDIGGVWPRPTLNGNVTVAGGALGLTPLGGVRLSDINANLDFVGDSVHIQRFQVLTREERVGNLTLGGWISVADRDDPRFDLTLGARNFHIIERPRVAHLDVSAQNLRLRGSYNSSTLTGLVIVDRGTIYIPELIDKQVISLDNPDVYSIIDTSLTTNRTLLPKAPPALVRNLLVDNVQVRMGNDVWLRSSEANINLGGAVAVKVGHSQSAERPFDQLALDGTLTTNRGTYRLSLGIFQRSFTVENGSVQFFGDPDFNPNLNINAIHTVHRPSTGGVGEQDIRVRVTIGGTLAQPRLTLSSADSLLNISQTDLVSYLLTGAPSFNVGTDAATASLLRSFGTVLGDWLRSGFGFVDVIDLELGRQGLALGQGTTGVRNSVFAGARLTTGWQIGDRTFVSASAGLCQVQALLGGGSGGSDVNTNLQNILGARVDYRLNENVGMSAAYEPSTNALLCNSGIGGRGFAPTPKQLGFDIFRTFRF